MNKLTYEARQWSSIYTILVILLLIACNTTRTEEKENDQISNETNKSFISYHEDVTFLEKYTDIIQLSDPSGSGKVALSPALQGRVMTSSSSGAPGRSYGWINRGLFESGDTLEHINVFGGEERFWLGPEGGQFSIFFKNGQEFNLETWQTPRLIDLEPFEVKEATTEKVVFTKTASLTNYSGFVFELGIEREIAILSNDEIKGELGLDQLDGIKAVGYQTTNILTNMGDDDWKKETGLLSIWLLGMFNPSPETTVIVSYIAGDETALGKPVNDEYFGKVPAERLIVKEEVIYFKGDGQFRSKIGLLPTRAKNVLGSYDASSKTLTIVKYNKPDEVVDYVNSLWEIQDAPYAGDVVNSYNDGSPEPGAKPLGPFYELETSSPALALKAGEQGIHIQMTCHFEGNVEALDRITQKVLGVSIEEIATAFK
ncbi:hypothetical protein QQ020_35780 [Fulvivirgaceae bacterium BMA12]|uniref:Lipoprotein n=1 Tax=Agaribacillus aureus TaxID=3051825 RepID=A0ABT8LMD4_9BACT|nr:hypothetical protein [Fulvivirgaceae bacterium BMA12]